MGDGNKLKAILDKQNKSVRWLAKETTISPTTLYSIIQKDTSIRFDFALRIANALDVDVSEISISGPSLIQVTPIAPSVFPLILELSQPISCFSWEGNQTGAV